MATTYSRCFHALEKIQSILLISKSRNQIGFQLRNYAHSAGKVPPNVLQSKASQFSGRRIKSFENPEVQIILKRLTGLNLDKIFKPRKEPLQNPVYKVMDKEELLQV